MMKAGKRFAPPLAALLLLLLPALCAAGPDAMAPVIERRPDLHAAIDRAVASIVAGQVPSQESLEELLALGGGRRVVLLQQLLLYLSESDSTEESMGGALLLHRLEFTPSEKMEAALPPLEGAPRPLRRALVDLLASIDRPEGGDPDFTLYESRIAREKLSPPSALIGYMFEVSPGAAARSMARVYGADGPGGRSALARIDRLEDLMGGPAHLPPSTGDRLSRARRELEALSGEKEWWLRLYAAATLRQWPALATPDLLAGLRSDPHPLVRAAASR